MKSWKFYANYCKKNPAYKLSKDKEASKERRKNAKVFKKEWGFDYGEVWNLDNSIATFLLPRIAYLREIHMGFPTFPEDFEEDKLHLKDEKATAERWDKELETMTEGLYLYLSKEIYQMTEEEKATWNKAKSLLMQRFEVLWD